MESKTYVWSFFGRLKHWLIVLTFILCYATSFYEEQLRLHIALGVVFFNMLLLKIVWAQIGPKYARWSDYKFELSALKQYFSEKIENRYRKITAGHNPASSWFAFLIVWVGLVLCISGFLLYGIQEAKGIFSFLNDSLYKHMNLFENLHIVLAYLSILLILTHISGVLIEQFYHKTSMVFAMITGYKKAEGENIQTSKIKNSWATFYVILTLLLGAFIYVKDENLFIKSKFTKIDYKQEHEDFYFECSDCHNIFPPHLLPKKSWVKLMKDQSEHYEEDLELDKDMINSITKYLVDNSAENSTREASVKLLSELKNKELYTISKTTYWKKTHKHIKKEVFKRDNIETKSNCTACHTNFENGLIEDSQIKVLYK